MANAANVGLMIQKRMAAAMLKGSDDKMGNWRMEYSVLADREYYYNIVSKQTSWDMPDEVRFYLPPQLEEKILKSFDYGHLECFKQYYSMLDVDNSGDLSDMEIKRLLDAMGVKLSPRGLAKLIETAHKK